MEGWKIGYPPDPQPGEDQQEFLDRYEVHFAPLMVWHRERIKS